MAEHRQSRIRRPSESTLIRALAAVAWLGCIPFVAFVLVRWTGNDRHAAIAIAQSFTAYVMIPVWAIAGFAWAARRRYLRVLAAALVLVHVSWLVPEIHRSAPFDAETLSAPMLTIFNANLLKDNPDVGDIAQEIGATQADVVLLQEYDRENRAAIRQSGVLDSYPYQIEFVENSSHGAMLASRVPFIESTLLPIAERAMPAAVLDTEIGPVMVVNVHTSRPVTGGEIEGWISDHAELETLVRNRTMPLILSGDFNATTGHGPFRNLLDHHMSDLHQSLGRGLLGSWPQDATLPAVVRIDHIVLSDELVPVSVRNGHGKGSDHIPIVATIALVGGDT